MLKRWEDNMAKNKVKQFMDSFLNSRRTRRKVDLYTRQTTEIRESETLRIEYRDSWILQKGIRTIPEDALKNWIDINFDDEDINKALIEECKRLSFRKTLFDACVQSRIFGGAVIIINTLDSAKMSEPINKPTAIDSLSVVAYPFVTAKTYYDSPFKAKYGQVKSYLVNSVEIHESRILHFEPCPIDYYERQERSGFSVPLSHKMRDEIKSFGLTNDGVQDILIDYSTKVLSIEGLIDKLVTNKTALEARLQYLAEMMSNDGLVIVSDKEKFEKIQHQLTGIDNLISFVMDTASAVFDMPRKKLFSQQLGTLAGADSSEKDYTDAVEKFQQTVFNDHVQMILNLINQIKFKSDENVPFEFNAVVSPTNAEMADIQLKVSQTVERLVMHGLITDEEARQPFMKTTKQTLLKLNQLEFDKPLPEENE
jgi:uncharacterized protein